MAEGPIPVKASNRKAREKRLIWFEALAAFANMGESPQRIGEGPQGWEGFRRGNPKFFPGYLTDWFYRTANDWWRMSHLSETPPNDWREFHSKHPESFPERIEDWAVSIRALREFFDNHDPVPPLLFYRNLLRRVWANEDINGNCLRFLLGFEAEALAGGMGGFFLWKTEPTPKPPPSPGWNLKWLGDDDDGESRISDLPQGRPVIDGSTGTISWSFACRFQSAIYELMQERWRAMICPQCHKYFIADKTAQKFCSTKCTGENKRQKQIAYYHRKGKFIRPQRKTTRAKTQRRKRQ